MQNAPKPFSAFGSGSARLGKECENGAGLGSSFTVPAEKKDILVNSGDEITGQNIVRFQISHLRINAVGTNDSADCRAAWTE